MKPVPKRASSLDTQLAPELLAAWLSWHKADSGPAPESLPSPSSRSSDSRGDNWGVGGW